MNNTGKRPSIGSLKTLTPQKCQEYSCNLERVVIALNRKEISDVKFAEIFIDINNKLHEIFTVGEYKEYPIFMLLSNFEENLNKFKEGLEKNQISNLDIMDRCISFKFLYYNMNNFFPSGKFINSFKLDDAAAETWWTNHFDDQRFVPVDTFWIQFTKEFPCIDDVNACILCIDFSDKVWFSEFVNKSSFKIFLRFYGGWDKMNDYWTKIYYHPGHMIMTTPEHAKEKLSKIRQSLINIRSPAKSFTFCLNWRCDEGLWNLLYIDDAGNIINTLKTPSELLKELSNKNMCLYPKGNDPVHAGYHIPIEKKELPAVPVMLNVSRNESIYDPYEDVSSNIRNTNMDADRKLTEIEVESDSDGHNTMENKDPYNLPLPGPILGERNTYREPEFFLPSLCVPPVDHD